MEWAWLCSSEILFAKTEIVLDFQAFFFGHDTWHIGILVPQPGIKLVASAVEAWSVNHWAAREVTSLC